MGNQSARETEKVEPFPEIEEGELIVIVAGGPQPPQSSGSRRPIGERERRREGSW